MYIIEWTLFTGQYWCLYKLHSLRFYVLDMIQIQISIVSLKYQLNRYNFIIFVINLALKIKIILSEKICCLITLITL